MPLITNSRPSGRFLFTIGVIGPRSVFPAFLKRCPTQAPRVVLEKRMVEKMKGLCESDGWILIGTEDMFECQGRSSVVVRGRASEVSGQLVCF